MSAAARATGVDRNSAYDLKDRDPAFALGWRKALERAHGELGLLLLATSREGSVRTEMVLDRETGKPVQVKLVHSYPLTIALRLFLSHRAEVEAFRLAGEAEGDDDIDARLAVRMDEIRARLLGGPAMAADADGGETDVREPES